MLAPITIRHEFRPVRRSLATGAVADLFGLDECEPPHTIAENLALDVRPGDLVLVTGPSGSGKSSLLRAAAQQLGALDVNALALPNIPLIDTLPGTVPERLAALAGCGLAEARLLLRTPLELSEGQRFRFRLALAFARSSSVLRPSSFENEAIPDRSRMTEDKGQRTFRPRMTEDKGQRTFRPRMTEDEGPRTFLTADEFTASLDRVLAKVVAFNVRKQVTRSGIGLLAATTHEDIVEDLQPDLWVRCCDGWIEAERRSWKRRAISFADDLWISNGSRSDWPHFARWHYRGHGLAFVRHVILLWHGQQPIGICIFTAPAASLSLRTHYFGLSNPRSRVALSAMNEQLWLLQRVVIHPTYRGAGIAAAFVRRACELCPVDWIETLTAMGHANPFFERAGFTRVGVVPRSQRKDVRAGIMQYAGTRRTVTAETRTKSRHSDPVYYVFDNRPAGRTQSS